MNIVKVLKGILLTVAYMAGDAIFMLLNSLIYIFKGEKKSGRIIVLLAYIGLGTAFVLEKRLFFGVIILLMFARLPLVVSIVKDTLKDTRKKSRKNDNPFFEGLNPAKAKEEYHRLMKLYHPNNSCGDFEMVQNVAKAYSEYCKYVKETR